MCKTWKWALLNNFGLAEDLPEEVPDTRAKGSQAKVGVFSRAENSLNDGAEAPPEKQAGGDGEGGKKEGFPGSKVARLGQRGERNKHSERTNDT